MSGYTCHSRFRVPVVGELRCLLLAPHDGYRHYAAVEGDWRRFWMWTDEQAVADD